MTGIVRQHSVVGLAIPPQEAIQIARRVLATEGYQSVAVGPTAATFVRDVRPQAVTIAAYACAIPTLGLSLFALLIRTQEQCTVTGETSRRGTGTALSLSGVVTTETLRDLEGALRHAGQQAPVPSPDDAYNQFPPPGRAVDQPGSPFPAAGRGEARSPFPSSSGRGADEARSPFPTPGRGSFPPPGYQESPPPGYQESTPLLGHGPQPLLGATPPPASPLPPAPPRPQAPVRGTSEPLPPPFPPGPDLLQRPRRSSAFPEGFEEGYSEPAPYSESDLDMTVVRASPLLAETTRRAGALPPPLPHWVLTLDDGRTIDIPDFALIGRDPEPGEDDPETGLVSLVDPEMSVSKTHASFGVDDEGLWFLDRFSTNGTSVQEPGGERVGLEPGIATPVLPGSDVWIGRRHLTVSLEDD